jgi:hypothetical protein
MRQQLREQNIEKVALQFLAYHYRRVDHELRQRDFEDNANTAARKKEFLNHPA